MTNKYLQMNDAKVATNDEIMRAEAAKRFWNTHEYDHVVGKFYDAAKEKKFVDERDAEAKIHGKDYCKKLPLTVQK